MKMASHYGRIHARVAWPIVLKKEHLFSYCIDYHFSASHIRWPLYLLLHPASHCGRSALISIGDGTRISDDPASRAKSIMTPGHVLRKHKKSMAKAGKEEMHKHLVTNS